MATDADKAPLLVTPVSAAKQPRQFKGAWYNPFGDCGGHDVAACCLAINVPHVAFGWNGSRALGLTWWKEALKLFLLTAGSFFLVRVIFTVMLMTTCASMSEGNLPSRGVNNEIPIALYNGEWPTATTAAMPVDTTIVSTESHWYHDDGLYHHQHFNHEDPFTNMSKEDMDECIMRTVLTPWTALLVAFAVACIVYASYFAALRRKNMRERFGIEGTFRSDWLLWFMCAPCAVIQETRTLMHNHVEEGLWHGPLTAPPQSAAMST